MTGTRVRVAIQSPCCYLIYSFGGRVSPCSPDWPPTHYSTDRVSQVQGLQAHITMTSLCSFFQTLPNSKLLDQKFFTPLANTVGIGVTDSSSAPVPSCPFWCPMNGDFLSSGPLPSAVFLSCTESTSFSSSVRFCLGVSTFSFKPLFS